MGGLILARLAIDFRRQVHFGTTVMVETEVERVGTSSIALRQGIYAVGETAEVAAEVESVVVHFDYKTNQPRRIPGGLRGKLAAFAAL